MRIWIVNHYALPPTSAGGTRHYNFARQLRQRGHEVVIIAANYNHFSHSFTPTTAALGELDHTHGVPFVWIPTPAYQGNTLSRFWNMLVFSMRLQQKKYLPLSSPPDVIIGSSPHLFAALSAKHLSKRLRKPFLLEIRDIWPDTLVDLGRFTHQHPLIRMLKMIEQHLYKKAKRVISLLPSADKYLTQCGVNPDHILWLPNAIDSDNVPSEFTPETKDIFTVMYAGSHGLANDLDTALDAAKILQLKGVKCRIALVGDGPDKQRLKDRVKNENISLIKFFDAVPKKEIYSMLNKADVFLMLLKRSPIFRWGISPNKLFDYLVMGRPVIFGVDTPFNPIESCNAGISIDPSDPAALAAAIEALSLLPSEELHAMGSRGKDFVLEKHDISYLTASLEKLITDVA